MTRDQGLRLLGLDARATEREVARAYRKRALPLKTQLLTAPRVRLKDRYRDELRTLVRARDAALGRPPRRPEHARIRVDGRRLLESLARTPVATLRREEARALLGVAPDASDDAVRAAYRLRARALVRRLAGAADEAEMSAVRRARMKLRTVRNFAL